jgi:hypothetical protein
MLLTALIASQPIGCARPSTTRYLRMAAKRQDSHEFDGVKSAKILLRPNHVFWPHDRVELGSRDKTGFDGFFL